MRIELFREAARPAFGVAAAALVSAWVNLGCGPGPASAADGVGSIVWRDLDGTVVPVIECHNGGGMSGCTFFDATGLVWNVEIDRHTGVPTVKALLGENSCEGGVFRIDSMLYGLRTSVSKGGAFFKFKADAKPASAVSGNEWGIPCDQLETATVPLPVFDYKVPLHPEFVVR